VWLGFTSTTQITNGLTGPLVQTAQTLAEEYDESDLSLFVSSVPALPLPLCFRSDLPPTTIAVIGSPGPAPTITGAGGCQWQSGNVGCIATGFAFGPDLGGVSGTLPAPLPASTIAALSASDTDQQLTASWSAAVAPGDTLTVAATSSYTTPGLFGADPTRTYTNTLSCEVAPGASPFVFPAPDAAWAFQYPSQEVLLTVTNRANQTFPLSGVSYDFLLVSVVSSVNAVYSGSF